VLVGVPVGPALVVALVAALPLSLLLFPGLGRDLNLALAEAGQLRRAQKARLRAELRGLPDRPAPQVDGVEGSAQEQRAGQPDRGAERPGQHDQRGVAEHRDELSAGDPAAHPPQRG
jgi:hypothetical protein